ncbi:MAG TPA: DUF6093 family protein [Pseudonocardia sp.]
MGAQTALLRGRALAESRMWDACIIRRRTDASTTDDITGVVTPVYTTVYTGKCRLQQSLAMGQRVESGQMSTVVERRELQLPVIASAAVRQDDEAEITVCQLDPGMVGRTFVLRDEHGKSEATARRMTCEEPT